jgi:hypothetical protein
VLDADLNHIDTQCEIPACYASAWDNGLNGIAVVRLNPASACDLEAYATSNTRGKVVEPFSQSTAARGGAIVKGRGVAPLSAAPLARR